MGDIAGKVWGKTRELFINQGVECHLIHAKAHAYCSKHRHLHKYNKFHVISGTLAVHVWKNDYSLTDVTVLQPGDSCTVKPGEYHKFVAHEDTVALEFYWAELDPSDIEREDVGGAAPPATDWFSLTARVGAQSPTTPPIGGGE